MAVVWLSLSAHTIDVVGRAVVAVASIAVVAVVAVADTSLVVIHRTW
jgi:hypothetical protein